MGPSRKFLFSAGFKITADHDFKLPGRKAERIDDVLFELEHANTDSTHYTMVGYPDQVYDRIARWSELWSGKKL